MTSTPRTRRAVAIAVVAVSAAAATVAIVFDPAAALSQALANGAFVAVGVLILLRRPGNAIGPLLIAFGLGFLLIIAFSVFATHQLDTGNTQRGAWLLLLSGAAFPLMAWLQLPIFVLFPSGTPTARWNRPFILATGLLAVVATGVQLLAHPTVFIASDQPVAHPSISEATADTMTRVSDVLLFVLVLMLLVAAVTLFPKWRRGDAVERRQIGWVAVASSAYIVIAFVNTSLQQSGAIDEDTFVLVDAIGVALIPLAIGIAIMRYRLYEIDTIVNRSLVYGTLALFIAGVYIGIVVGIAAALGGRISFELSILATVVVALAFQPVRRRVERWANRLVYGKRVTPYEILQRFSRRSAEMTDEALLERVPHLIVDGTGSTRAAVWLRSGDEFRTASAWPDDAVVRTQVIDGDFNDPESDFSQPIFHDGELLGGLSLTKASGEAMTPQDEELLRSLASGLGLALRNARLTASLRARVAELEASRERILLASDAARRDLENSLDSGAQQTLVAVKVRLGPTQKLAERGGATKTADLLAQLEQEAGDAIASVRDFAAGIYPPLLEAEGLAVAIGHQADKAALPVSVQAEGVQRYPREIEAAVYFSVLEALQNTAKYAGADTAAVILTPNRHVLHFEVRDDGAGFDPATVPPGSGLNGMTDRLDTVGGEVSIRSAPGAGTAVVGSVPIDGYSPASDAHTSSRASMLNDDLGRNPMAPAATAGSS